MIKLLFIYKRKRFKTHSFSTFFKYSSKSDIIQFIYFFWKDCESALAGKGYLSIFGNKMSSFTVDTHIEYMGFFSHSISLLIGFL